MDNSTDRTATLSAIIDCLHQAGIGETELDDLIFDIASHEAATAANLEENDQQQEAAIDAQFLDATTINNGGMQAQVTALVDYYGSAEAIKVLQDAFEQERLEIRVPAAHPPVA